MERLYFKNFPHDDRIWRLNWIGAIQNHRPGYSPSEFRLSFSPVDDLSASHYSMKFIAREVVENVMSNVGFLPMLTLGSLWKNGRTILHNGSADDSSVTFNLHTSLTPNIKPFNELIAPRAYMVGLKTSHAPCLIIQGREVGSQSVKHNVQASHKVTTIIIPCTEILRFYFGTSSTLIRKLVHGAATNINQFLVIQDEDGRRSGFIEKNILCLTLRKMIADVNAWPIARIICDRIAAMTTQQLYADILSQRKQSEEAYVKMNLPFDGESNLKCQGKWVKFSDSEWAFLALRLVSCTADIPCRGMLLDRENSNRVMNKDGTKEMNYPPKAKPNNDGEIATGGGNAPGTEYGMDNVEFKEQEDRFGALRKKFIDFRYKEHATYKARRYIYKGAEVSSSEPGLTNSNNPDIAPLEIFIDLLGEKQNVENICAANAYTLWQSVYYLIRRYKMNVNVVVVETGIRTVEYKLSHFPTRGSKWAVMHDENGARPRTALWLELRTAGRWIYIVEWEGKPREFGIYIMQQNNGIIRATNNELCSIMSDWALDGDRRRSGGLGRGWIRESMQHVKDGNSKILPLKIAEKIAKRLTIFPKNV